MADSIKHLGLSGGGTKIHGLFAAAKEVMKNHGYYPDYYTGISAGAILAIPLALRLYDEIEAITSTLTLKTFFSKSPVNKKNKISIWAVLRATLGALGITKTNSLGEMGNLEPLLRKVITPERFKEYQESKETFISYVGYIDAKTAGRRYVNLKEVDYETAIKSIIASSSIPVFTEPVHIGGDIGIDGGVRDHIGTGWILDQIKIDKTISIYSRPESLEGYLDPIWKDKNFLGILMRTMDILLMEVSKSDEKIEDEICSNKKIGQKKIFLPKIMDGFYDVAPEKMELLYQAGIRNAREVMNQPW
jgi:predicted acylesterase/phospholipase RssA